LAGWYLLLLLLLLPALEWMVTRQQIVFIDASECSQRADWHSVSYML
jgi:hypothetical protein